MILVTHSPIKSDMADGRPLAPELPLFILYCQCYPLFLLCNHLHLLTTNSSTHTANSTSFYASIKLVPL